MVSAGVDFGDVVQLQTLPRLSLLEEILISLQIPYGYLIKLRQMDGVSQRALKGHIITFRTDAADSVAQMDADYQAHMELPHASDSGNIKASFVGPEGNKDYLTALGLEDGPLRCDLDKMMEWLLVLKKLHPGYRDVALRQRTAANKDLFAQFPNKILSVAQHVTSETCRAMEQTVGADVAGVRDVGGLEDDVRDDEEGMEVDVEDPQAMRKLNVYFQTCAILSAADSDGARAESVLDELHRLVEGEERRADANADPEEWEPGKVQAGRESVPLSEYGEKSLDSLLAGVFPTRAIFGTFGPPGDRNGAFPVAFTEYLMMHSSCTFAQDVRFPFMLFNMLQRKAVARATNLRIKSESDVVERFMSICNHADFKARLQRARQDPKSEDSRKMLAALEPLMASIGSKVPYSPSARRASFAHCLASMLRFGTAAFFLTMSFDDKSNCLSVRLSHPLLNPKTFPGADQSLRACMERKDSIFTYCGHDGKDVRLDINDKALLRLVSENPAAASAFFRTQFDAVLECLLGIQLDRKRTVPIGAKDGTDDINCLGVLGLVTDFNGNVEVNQVKKSIPVRVFSLFV